MNQTQQASQAGFLLDTYYLNDDPLETDRSLASSRLMKLMWDEKDRRFWSFDWSGSQRHYPYAYVHDIDHKFRIGPKGRAVCRGSYQMAIYHPIFRTKIPVTKYVFNSPGQVRDHITVFKDGAEPNPEFQCYENHIRYTVRQVMDKDVCYGMPYHLRAENIVPNQLDEQEKAWFNDSVEKMSQTGLSPGLVRPLLKLLLTNMPKLPIVAFDIECTHRGPVVPDPKYAPEPVTSIAFAFSDEQVFEGLEGLVLALDHKIRGVRRGLSIRMMELIKARTHRVEWFNTETDLLKRSLTIMAESNAAIMTTYHGDGFDLLYLLNRMRIQNFRDIPFKSRGQRGDKEYMTYEPMNAAGLLDVSKYKVHIDLHKFFRQTYIKGYVFSNKYVDLKLDTVAKALLGVGKIEHELDINDLPLWELIDYNMQDAKITLDLLTFDDHISLNIMIMFMRLGYETMSEVSRRAITGKIGNLFLWRAKKRGWILPNKSDMPRTEARSVSTSGKGFRGAIVVDPVPGFHFDVRCDDFEGLYTNLIFNKNISPETIDCHHPECIHNIVPDVGYHICTREKGLASEIIGFITKVRGLIFKPLKKIDSARWKPVEQGLKVFGNASYGALSAEFFDWYSMPCAESTTAHARDATQHIIDKSEELGMEVIYGDTDSVFLKHATDEKIETLYNYSMSKLGLKLDLEYMARLMIISTRKKNYLIIKYDNSHIIRGLKAKKSNTPLIVKTLAMDIIEVIKDIFTPEDIPYIISQVESMVESVSRYIWNKKGGLEQYAFTMKVSKPYHSYGREGKRGKIIGIPQHVKAAKIEAKHILQEVPAGIRQTINIEDLIPIGKLQTFVKTLPPQTVLPLTVATNDRLNAAKYLEELVSTLSPITELFNINLALITSNRSKKLFEDVQPKKKEKVVAPEPQPKKKKLLTGFL